MEKLAEAYKRLTEAAEKFTEAMFKFNGSWHDHEKEQ